MNKSICSRRAISKQQKPFAVIVWRLTVTGLLVLAVVSLALPISKHAGAAAQPAYSKVSLSAGANPTAAKIGDLDGDGRNDIAVVDLQGSLQLFFGNGAGSFDRISLDGLAPSNSNALDLDIGDLNGDGRNDIAVAFSSQTGAVSVLFNQGDRAFGAPVSYFRIDLAWDDKSNDETKFELERCAGSACDNFAKIAEPAENASSYSNSGLSRGTTYRYRIKACNGSNCSNYSNIVSGTTR